MRKNIKRPILVGFAFASLAIPTLNLSVHAQGNKFTGSVERVWDDGFRLNTGDKPNGMASQRTFNVDSWDVYGDDTPENLVEGDQVTVMGEFDDGEFDADSVSK
ncbi:MAG: hypothetical protein AAF298_21875 [Cyanobacteria bacterium P01_A01_bin.40]